jgi:hypothetical protein
MVGGIVQPLTHDSLPIFYTDFCQLSGMHLLVGRYLEAGSAGLRWRAAQLIGTCSQNVAAIQEQVLGLGALRKLLRLLDRDSCDTVRVKALFAISCECPRGAQGRGPGSVLAKSTGDPLGAEGGALLLSLDFLHLLGLCTGCWEQSSELT